MVNPWLDWSCCQAHPDTIRSTRYLRKQRSLQFHGQAGSIPSHPFGLNDFHTTALPNINDSYRSSTMGLTPEKYEGFPRTEHPPGTIPFDRSVCHTSTTNFSNLYQSVSSQVELHVTLPPFLANTGDQTLSLKKHFQEYAYGSPPDVVRFRDTAHGQSFSTDATPFDALALHGTRDLEDFTSSTLRSNGENIQYAAYSHRPYNAEHLPVIHPSYVPIGHDVVPTTDIIRQWPSSIAAASNISATHCSAPQITSYDSFGRLGTLTPLQRHYKNSESNDIHSSTLPSVSRPRRRRVKQEPCLSDAEDFNPPTVPSVSRPRRRLLKQEPWLSDADSSDTSTSHILGPMKLDPSDINSSDFSNTRLLVPKEPPLDDVDYSKTATPYHPVKIEPSLEELEPFKTSTENEADADYVFKKYTYQEDDSSDECQVSGFGAPKAHSVSPQHTSDTLDPCAAEYITMRPVGDAGFEERLQPQEMDCQQTIPNILSAASEPHEKEKKPRVKKEKEEKTKANPNRVRKNYSSRRRHNPKILYWCIDPTCKASQDRGFRGFRTTEDTRHHLAMHEPHKMLCKLPHKEGIINYEGRRTDHLREHIRHVHKDRSVDEPEIKEMIDS